MESSTEFKDKLFIIDSIHGDIHLSEQEIRVIDTQTFQRLRKIKQLQMSHLTYPNATHTRFMHSLGVLGIMIRVQQIAKERIKLSNEEKENLRLAALLHDIGHYPYSHLMEDIERVSLIEEKINESEGQKTLSIPAEPFPEHEALGVKILQFQNDIINAIGSRERAKEIADIFSGDSDNPKLTKLITSSLDLDRFDYLQRDAIFTGLPYGQIDLNYLLNSLQMSADGDMCVCDRAIPAVEHYLLARYFMYRVVYYHRTTVAFEEACRQLLRRIRNQQKYELPIDGNSIEEIATSRTLHTFTDSYVDNIIQKATMDDDEVIQSLALSIQSRNAPKLIKEVLVLEEKKRENIAGVMFRSNCYRKLNDLALKFQIPLGLFLFYESKPITFEKEDARYRLDEIEAMTEKDKKTIIKKQQEIVQIFPPDSDEPRPIFDFEYSLIHKLKDWEFRIYRLYLVPTPSLDQSQIQKLKMKLRIGINQLEILK